MKYGQSYPYQYQGNYQPVYNPSTHLYEPLKDALKDYRRIPQQLQKPAIDSNCLKHSKVTKTNRSLTSSQAENIKASIVFPQNKTLVPTNNLKRVEGKTFVTVGVKQKVRQPISYHQFLRVKTDCHQQIVYQIQEEDELNKVFTYTTASTKHTLPTANTQPSLARLPEPKLHSKTKSPPETSLEQRTRFLSQQNENKVGAKQFDYGSFYRQQQPRLKVQYRNQEKTRAPVMEMPSFVDTLPRKFSYSYNQAENQLVIEPNQAKAYAFRKEGLTNYQQIMPPKIIQNKLNLFNMLDQCGSRGCDFRACKSNELCASRVPRAQWK